MGRTMYSVYQRNIRGVFCGMCYSVCYVSTIQVAELIATFLKLLCLLVPCSVFWLCMMSRGVSLSFSFRLSISVFSSLSCSCRCLLFSMYSTLNMKKLHWLFSRFLFYHFFLRHILTQVHQNDYVQWARTPVSTTLCNKRILKHGGRNIDVQGCLPTLEVNTYTELTTL